MAQHQTASIQRPARSRRSLAGRIAAAGTAFLAASAMATAPASAQSAGLSPEHVGSLVQAAGSGNTEHSGHAPEGGARLVTIGDSLMAGTNLPVVDGGRGCARSTERYVAKIARDLGIYDTPDFQDTSCFGATIDSPPAFRLVDQAKFHEDNGSFGPRTEHVLIQAGLNDFWGTPGVNALGTVTQCVTDLINGCTYAAVDQGRAQDPRAITAEAYAERAKVAVDYIKHYAPNARVSFVGYPTMFTPDNRTCVSVAGMPAVQPRDEIVPALLNNLDAAQRGAAEQLGIGFIDLKSPSAQHGSCSAQPWVGGLLDPQSGFIGVPAHLNQAGEQAVADIVKNQM